MDEGTRQRRGLQPSRLVPAVAPGWELTFSLPGIPYLEPAFAALRPAPVCCHGVCLELDAESWLRLLQTEGVLDVMKVQELRSRKASLEEVLDLAAQPRPYGYRLAEMTVDMYSGSSMQSLQRRTAYTLAAADDTGEAPLLPPSVRYWRLLRNGARRHGLDRRYRDFLASLPRYSPSLLASAAIPDIMSNALLSYMEGGRAAQEAWPELTGPAGVARGYLDVGPMPAGSVWTDFCSTPRDVLLRRLRASLREDVKS
eukprot:TRINITY_DN39555_c0_g1_i2.p1 TRINITY_DN39555_c0_g1~~TRINITY_DN39555_c0_g1_i2.p1  ORF type:complete len:256 (+),score=43.44 TRINITY_DN39555_c0_g1_i2:242-1009(+)